MLEFTGSVVKIGETQAFGSKGFTKREFVLKEAREDDKWPNLFPFVLTKDRCNLVDDIGEGAKVKVSFVLNGRAWDKGDGSPVRYFCDNQVLKLEILEVAASSKPANVPAPAEPPVPSASDGMDDDMPF